VQLLTTQKDPECPWYFGRNTPQNLGSLCGWGFFPTWFEPALSCQGRGRPWEVPSSPVSTAEAPVGKLGLAHLGNGGEWDYSWAEARFAQAEGS